MLLHRSYFVSPRSSATPPQGRRPTEGSSSVMAQTKAQLGRAKTTRPASDFASCARKPPRPGIYLHGNMAKVASPGKMVSGRW